MTVWDHAIAVLLGLVLPVVAALQQRRLAGDAMPLAFDTRDKIVLYWSNSAVLWILAGATLFVWRHGGRTLAELGLTAPPERMGVGLLLAFAFALVYTLDTLRQLAPERIAATRARWRRDSPFMPATAREVAWSTVLVASAAVCEEILYRGFLIAYLVHFTGASPLGLGAAVVLPAVIFAACHTYQGRHAMAKIVLLSVVFGAITVATGSLMIPIALHLAVDGIASVLGPKLFGSGLHGPDAALAP